MARRLDRVFAGMRPGRDPELLQPGESALAVNVRFNDGGAEPIPGLSGDVLTLSTAGTVRTIYRFGQLLTSETQHWFESSMDADFVKGPIADDTTERTYFTGTGYPRKTNSILATGTAPLPTNSYRMGVVRPGGTPGVPEAPSSFVPGVTTSGTSTAENVTVIYCVTYVTEWGEESAPSANSALITYKPGQTNTITLPSAPSGNYALSGGAGAKVRIYRSNTGSESTAFQRVAEVAIGTPTYADTVPASQLGATLGSSTFDEPDDRMVGLTLLPNGGMMGFFGNQLCFSEPGFPHAWPIRYRRSMAAPIVALAAFEGTVVVFTTRGTYLLSGSEPANMVESTATIPFVCLSKRSVRRLRDGIVFASSEGLIHIRPGAVDNITESIMAPEDWAAYAPATVEGYVVNDQYVAFFNTGSRQAGFVLKVGANASFTETDIFATAGFTEPSTGTLFLVVQGNKLRKWQGGAPSTLLIRSGVLRSEKQLVMSRAQVRASSYPVTFRLYADGTVQTHTVLNSRIFVLVPFRANGWYYEVQGAARITSAGFATTASELTRNG